jgi:hypothetical protein
MTKLGGAAGTSRVMLWGGALLAVVSVAWFHRIGLASGFRLFPGDGYDPLIEAALLQHWANVLAGREAWHTLAYFYPVRGTLGYNDPYLLYGLIYAPFRWAGLNPIAAACAVHAVMKLAGFVGMTLLLRRVGRVRAGWALVGATLFTIADLTLQHASHGQLFTAAFVPFALLFVWQTMTAVTRQDRHGVLRSGVALAVIMALWISTAFYLAWFFILLMAILGVVAALDAGRDGRALIIRGAARSWPTLTAVALLGVVLLVPFATVYLPKAAETGMRTFDDVRRSGFAPLDYIAMPSSNTFWGPLFDLLRERQIAVVQRDPDLMFGLPPFLFAAAIAAVLAQRHDERRRPLFWLGMAMCIAWLCMLKIPPVSPWRAIFALVPGAGAIRVIGRFNLVLLVPAILLLIVWLDSLRRPAIAWALAALLLLEQYSASASQRVDARDAQAVIAAVPPLPAGCRSFFVVAARRGAAPWSSHPEWDGQYTHNVDAMLLAELRAQPSVNGFSSFNPPQWDFADPLTPDYPDRVRRYAAAYGLRDLCGLDMRRAKPWFRLD